MKKNKKNAAVETPAAVVAEPPKSEVPKTFAAKDIAALLHMSAKNLRKHLRNLEVVKNAELGRYRFTPKQAEKLVAQIDAQLAAHKAQPADAPAAE